MALGPKNSAFQLRGDALVIPLMGSSPRVGVVVCTHLHERIDQLRQALASLERQTLPPTELLVVVDGDKALQGLIQTQYPDMRVLCTPQRSGLSAARNLGVQALASEIVAFLDDDAIADNSWLENLYVAISEEVVGSSGRSVARWEVARPWWLPEEFLWTLGCSYKGMPSNRTIVRNVIGGCAAIRRDCFLAAGGYDARLGYRPGHLGGGEEAELGLKIAALWPSARFVFEPAAIISHYVPRERSTWSYFVRRCYAEGRAKRTVAALTTGFRVLSPERNFAKDLVTSVGHRFKLAFRGNYDQLGQIVGLVLGVVATTAGLAIGERRLPESSFTAAESDVLRPLES